MKLDEAVERTFEAPAVALEKSVEAAGRAEEAVVSKRPFRMAEEYLDTLGPGLTTGAADDDPSGIATYSQTGAQYGLGLLWLSLFTFPLMAVVQEMCARIGIATGVGLAANIRTHSGKRVLYLCASLLFIANTFNLGADLGAMAAAGRLLLPMASFAAFVALFAAVSLLLQVFTTYARYAKILKYLTLVLLAYVAAAFAVHVDWSAVAVRTLIPSLTFSRDEILLVCAILGTTISPYLFFWQTSQEVEEKQLHSIASVENPQAVARTVRRMRTDVWSGMFFSNAVMFFIIVTCASAFAANGVHNIATAAQAAAALKPLAGETAYLLFALGIIGTGMLAIPTMAGSASYAIAESFKWDAGLYHKLRDAYAFYGVIIISMVIGVLMNFIGLDPIKALIYAAVLNGLIAPIVLVLIVQLSGSRQVMGEYASGPVTRFVGWLTVALMTIAGIGAIVSLIP